MGVRRSVFISFSILSFTYFSRLFVVSGVSELGYIKYLAPILAIFVIFIYKERKIGSVILSKFYNELFFLFSVVSFLTIISNIFIFHFGFTVRNLFNIIIVFMPLVVSLAILKIISLNGLFRLINFIFAILFVAYMFQLFLKDISLSSVLTIFNSNFFLESEFETESGLSLVFCFFVIYYYNVRKYNMAALSLLLTVLGGKRIALLAVFVSCFVYLVYPYLFQLSKYKMTKKFLLVVFYFCVFSVALMWEAVYSRVYDDLIREFFSIDPNQLFMGRLNRFSDFYFFLPDLNSYFIGYGLGYAENVFYYKMLLETPVHNDYFRYYLELGPIFFSIWIFILLKISFLNRLNFSIFFLLLVLIQTDNVLIYDEVMCLFYIMLSFGVLHYNSESVKLR